MLRQRGIGEDAECNGTAKKEDNGRRGRREDEQDMGGRHGLSWTNALMDHGSIDGQQEEGMGMRKKWQTHGGAMFGCEELLGDAVEVLMRGPRVREGILTSWTAPAEVNGWSGLWTPAETRGKHTHNGGMAILASGPA